MSKNLKSPTKLTEFGPLQNEDKPQTVGHFISRLFKSWSGTTEESTLPGTSSSDACSQDLPSWVDVSEPSNNTDVPYNVDINEGRSLPNVLKRISNLIALKSNNLQDYGDTDLKQYWMPDSVSKQCYECSEKFTTFRRRHHCRVCGQIFCSNCCNQHIPGRIFGCTGDLRVCTYCCKIVLSYLSSDITDLTRDLKLLQETLRLKLASSPLSPDENLVTREIQRTDSFDSNWSKFEGYQEEMFVGGGNTNTTLSLEEKCRAFQNSTSLRNLFEEISKPIGGITLNSHRFRLRTYSNCFLGSELVDWLIYQQKANNRIQAIAICQALLEGNYIEHCVPESTQTLFLDGVSLFKLGNVSPEIPTSFHDIPTQDEPSWVQQILQESSNFDSDPLIVPNSPFLRTSSSYMLDLNVEASTVYLSRPSSSNVITINSEGEQEKPEIRTSEQREFVPESGWYKASNLREENGEKMAYEILNETYENHEQNLIKQLLMVYGLNMNWSDVIGSVVRELVEFIRPDKNHNARNLDVRHYVQIKKIPGGLKSDTEVLCAVACSKNVAHKEMLNNFENPKVLLLQGAIVYQRTEGRFMSLEPVLMQEHEYLRNLCARIVALQPDIVLVQRNVSRLAQDFLREKRITLVHNVKESTLERLSNCLQADLVGNLDAHIGRVRLGSCKKFYVKNYKTKTLMFFEGFQERHLGSTVLLRGGVRNELEKVKKILSFVLFSNYNWRLEKSFLMDEFAQPPNLKNICEFLDEKDNVDVSSSCTPNKKIKEKLNNSENSSLTVEKIDDFSDPLHSNSNEIMTNSMNSMHVLDLPFSNKFRKALDDTILCISPFIIFPIPYLETESGKKCYLRKFFPEEIYQSEQFKDFPKSKRIKSNVEEPNEREVDENKPPHAFTLVKLTENLESSNEIQNLLANFRACGGRYEKKLSILKKMETRKNCEENGEVDVFDPMNHQRLAVLFCSFSAESQNAPAFCMNPGVVFMDFYGRNDIPLGCFLEKYCFRSSYTCPSNSCTTPMVKHVRRFVHNSGCVSIFLNSFESGFSEENIVMWSWCSKCQSVSPVVPMSGDTWSYSFAKYLELKFYGSKYSRRGNVPCEHSLHHDHYQYFGYKNDVASFRYTPINIWEISLPPLLIEIDFDFEEKHRKFINEIKDLAQKGHDTFSVITEKIMNFPSEISEKLVENLSKDKAIFRQKIEELQLKLTSPSVEEKNFNFPSPQLKDSMILSKKFLNEIVDFWNVKLSENSIKTPVKNEEKLEEEPDENLDKQKSVKNLLSQLLPSSGGTKLPSPFPITEHYNLPAGIYGFLMVSENDLSSIIAYALNSFDFKKKIEENLENPKAIENENSEESARTILGFLRNNSNSSSNPQTETINHDFDDNKKLHVDVVFEDATCNFLCRIYYAEKFEKLRKLMMPKENGEEIYIKSLSKSSPWNARGGKSGSLFIKTVDDRFILKETSKNEVQLFLENANNYFEYITKCYATNQPTLLGKIVGIYQIIFKNNVNGQQLRKNLLVMENLFYNRNVKQKFDLKGSIRNRLVIPSDNQEGGEIVLLDENLLKMNSDSPLYILPHSKIVLTAAIENDTEFLASQFVMDYSLLVGLDNDKKELVLGIIDYIRTFTWDKKLETIVKKSGILGGQGKQPTIISPIEYQKRFIEAMHKYFLEVPDHWEGLGTDLEC